jgi:aminoglycoside 3-N-acetyltransferase
MRKYACVIADGDGRRWVEYDDVVLDDQKFDDIGQSLEKNLPVRRGKVGRADCRLVPLHAAVEFAAGWLAKDRGITPG